MVSIDHCSTIVTTITVIAVVIRRGKVLRLPMNKRRHLVSLAIVTGGGVVTRIGRWVAIIVESTAAVVVVNVVVAATATVVVGNVDVDVGHCVKGIGVTRGK